MSRAVAPIPAECTPQDRYEQAAPPEPAPKEWTLLFSNAGYTDESKMCTGSLVDLEKVGSDGNTHVVAMNHRSRWMPETVLGLNAEFDGICASEASPGLLRSGRAYRRMGA